MFYKFTFTPKSTAMRLVARLRWRSLHCSPAIIVGLNEGKEEAEGGKGEEGKVKDPPMSEVR